MIELLQDQDALQSAENDAKKRMRLKLSESDFELIGHKAQIGNLNTVD